MRPMLYPGADDTGSGAKQHQLVFAIGKVARVELSAVEVLDAPETGQLVRHLLRREEELEGFAGKLHARGE